MSENINITLMIENEKGISKTKYEYQIKQNTTDNIVYIIINFFESSINDKLIIIFNNLT